MAPKYPKIIFRPASIADYDELLKDRKSFGIVIPKRRELNESLLFIARDKITKEILGFCQVSQTNKKRIYIKRKAVRETVTGRKVGRKMLGKLTAYAIKQGYTMLGVSSNTTFGSNNFWRNKAKFSVHSGYLDYMVGEKEDSVFWRLKSGGKVLPQFIKRIGSMRRHGKG